MFDVALPSTTGVGAAAPQAAVPRQRFRSAVRHSEAGGVYRALDNVEQDDGGAMLGVRR